MTSVTQPIDGAAEGQEDGALADGGVHGRVVGLGSCDLSRSGWAST